ncbi:MAG: tetratricopeptide repeat protein [Deltaproteobacteria bacterium]|nr:tetratricopeptide repeat protein [Deltaproteobacteria bacterium]
MKTRLLVAVAAASLSAALPVCPVVAQEYLGGIDNKAQDAMRAGLSHALRAVPKCSPYRILDNGGCCPSGFVSIGASCERIGPNQCAELALENPEACVLDRCATYVKTEKKKEKIKTEEGKEEEVEKDVEVPCEPWVAGKRDLACELDTKKCDDKVFKAAGSRWCGDWMKKLEAPPAADAGDGKAVPGTPNVEYIRCKPGTEGCELIPRECSEKELESGSSDGAGPCKVGEYIDKSTNKCSKYECPAVCKASDGRCSKCEPDYVSAVQEFSRAVDADKRFYEAYFNLGMAYERLGKYDDARKAYEAAKSIEPRDDREKGLQLSAQAYIARSLLAQAQRYIEAGETAKAHALGEQAKGICDSILGQDPDNAMNNVALALYWLQQDDLKLAAEFVRKALRVNREDTIALNIRGLINLKQGKYDIARWILEEKVLQIDPANAEGWANLGMVYVNLGDQARAVVAFKNAVQLNKSSVSARLNLGAIYLEYLNYRDAARAYKQALELERDNLEALTGYALALEGLREPKEAANYYERVLAKDPKRHAILVRLAIIYYKYFNDSAKATAKWKAYLKEALDTEPDSAQAVADKLKADRDGAREALRVHMGFKKPIPNPDWDKTLPALLAMPANKKGGTDWLAKKAELLKKTKDLDLRWKNLIAIVSRIQEIEQSKLLEKQAKEGQPKDSAPPAEAPK